jgi:PKD repeat protein
MTNAQRILRLSTLLAAAYGAMSGLGAQLIDTVDYSDTFTLGVNGRANGVYNTPAPYVVEDAHGNPPTSWAPLTNYSFNDIPGSFGSGPTVLAAATGNPGAATGVAQSGGGDFSFAYGLRTDYVVEMDAFLSPGDRTDMTSGPTPGGGIFEANSLSVFFRRTSQGTGMIGIYNGAAETSVGSTDVDDDNWHKLAVRFNQDDDRLVIYVDGAVKADLDLATFAGGAYRNYSNGAVGAGGAGAFVDGKVLWFDNFRVGTPTVYADDFNRSDRPVDGWTVFRGGWNITGGELVTGPTGAEHWAWAGSPAATLPSNATMSFDMRFLSDGTVAGIGRHAGAMFYAAEPTERFAATNRGYCIWWIDRADDFGISLYRFANGGFTPLHAGTFGAVASPPLRWRVEVAGAAIRIYGDDVLYVDVTDNTYRDGIFGLWTWAGGQEVAFDNVQIAEPSGILAPCIQVGPEARISDCPITFSGACSVVSDGPIARYDWDFGDGATASGPGVAHTYAAGGTYDVTLTIEDAAGGVATETETIAIANVVLNYGDNFNRADGPVDGWTVHSGNWAISGNQLTAGPSAGEFWIWAGSPPVYAPARSAFQFEYKFLAPGTVPAVGRHGGFQFCANRPSHRYAVGWSGYFIDWIDRPSDRGVRLTRVDNGAFNELVRGQGAEAPANPPTRWAVLVQGPRIQVFGDDRLFIDIEEDTYRGGHFGFWTWDGGQQVAGDNLLLLGEALGPCCTATPATPLAGASVLFDASCSKVFGGGSTITSYEWDFGDGSTATGVTAEHAFATADTYTVTLTLRDSLGARATTAKTIGVADSLIGFQECFDRPAGPVDGWTAALGAWNITADGRVDTVTTSTEAFLYAGSPPSLLGPEFVAEVDWTYLGGTNPAVGRHGAVHFFWNTATTNRFAADSSGYAVFYIERASDRGLTLARWDGAALAVLNPPGGTPAFPEPPARLRIQVDGSSIRVYADGMLAIEAMDDTYRSGLFGLWSWNENHVQFDNVRIWNTTPIDPCGATSHLAADCTLDGARDISDVVCYVQYAYPGFDLFHRSAPPAPCSSAAGNLAVLDYNGDGVINSSDVVGVAMLLFTGGGPPVQGLDCFTLGPELGCASNPACP